MTSIDVSLLSLMVTFNFRYFSVVSIAEYQQVIVEWEIYNILLRKSSFQFLNVNNIFI